MDELQTWPTQSSESPFRLPLVPLRDPTPLFATNVEALRGVLDVAVEVGVPKFVFCSTVGTIGIAEQGLADETTPHTWADRGGPYIEARLQAENLVLAAGRERGLPVVVLNVGTTYGPRDHGPTPHGGWSRWEPAARFRRT